MQITIPLGLIGIAFILTLIHAITARVPLWIAVLLICVAFLAR